MKKIESATIYTMAFGNYWEQYGEQFTKNILNLNTMPERILIISDKKINTEFDTIVTGIPENRKTSHLRNIAVYNSNTNWIVPFDLDDIPSTNLIDNLNNDVDLHAFAHHVTNEITMYPDSLMWDRLLESSTWNGAKISANNAFKLDTIKKLGGYPNMEWDDAGILCKLRKSNSSVFFDHEIRFTYAKHDGSLSKTDVSKKDLELKEYLRFIRSSDQSLYAIK